MDLRDLVRRVRDRALAIWQQRKLPDAELRELLESVRDDAGHACRHSVTDDYFLEPERRQRLDALEQWSHRLTDRRLRHLVAAAAASGNETWAKTKSPAVVEQDARWTGWQLAAARGWLSVTKSALERVDTIERRGRWAESHVRSGPSR